MSVVGLRVEMGLVRGDAGKVEKQVLRHDAAMASARGSKARSVRMTLLFVWMMRFCWCGDVGLAVLAVQAIRRMRGGAQSQLMLGADGKLWVVKFQNNPQHLRVLANELMATRLAEAVGLTVPASDVVEVTEWLVANTAGHACGAGARAAGAVCGGAAVWVAVCGRVDAGAGGGLSAGAAVGGGEEPGGVCRDAVHR